MSVQELQSAARSAVHSIFDARGADARLAAAREGRGPHRPHSAAEEGAARHPIYDVLTSCDGVV